MHDRIRRFSLTGTITSDTFVSARDGLIRELEASMRDTGYVPVLDLIPQFTRRYLPSAEHFEFELSIYGVQVGDRAWELEGMTNGTLVEKSTQKSK